MDPETLHKLILAGFEGRDNAYAPYSKFRVGAALLADDGTVITGCNVENASYGAGICAERTAMTRAIVMGKRNFLALVVTSDVPEPTTSPCGICRQFIREFFALDVPVYIVSSTYPQNSSTPPAFLMESSGEEFKKKITMMTMEELLPMSFGPDNLLMRK